MSLILDALRRSGSEATVAVDPVLEDGPPHSTGRRWFWVALVIVAVAVVGVVVMPGLGEREGQEILVVTEPASPDDLSTNPIMSPEGDAPIPPLAQEEAVVVVADPADTGLARVEPESGESGLSTADDGRIAELHRQMWSDAEQPKPVQPDSPPLSEPSREVGQDFPVAGDGAPQSIAPPIDLAKAMQRAAEASGESTLVPHPALLLENLSQQQKDRVPTIVYSDHVYAAAGVSTVELNSKRLLTGQRTGGIEVIEILIDSVILRAGGSEFRLRALNTWVNL